MLLSNLTAATPACSTLLTLKVKVIPDSRLSNGVYPIESRCGSCPEPVPYPSAESRDVPALPLLINAFVEGAQVVESGDLSKRTRKASLHFLASVFANMTAVIRAPLIITPLIYCLLVACREKSLPITSTHRCPQGRLDNRISSRQARGFHRARRYHPSRRCRRCHQVIFFPPNPMIADTYGIEIAHSMHPATKPSSAPNPNSSPCLRQRSQLPV
jgi:hypothetical protein